VNTGELERLKHLTYHQNYEPKANVNFVHVRVVFSLSAMHAMAHKRSQLILLEEKEMPTYIKEKRNSARKGNQPRIAASP
jgi:hypothetical protein